MESWRPESSARPKVISAHNLGVALALHVAFFLMFWVYSLFHFKSDEVIVPIDLSIVVVENLDGNEDEPPPLKKPEEPPPPPPAPKPKPEPPKAKEPEKPKELEKIVTNIVTKVEKKAKVEEKKEKEKKPEPPKKSAKELREERIQKMRESAKTVNKSTTVTRQPNGRTDKKTLTDAEIQRLLNMGYKPGRTTNLAANEEQLCYSLIKQAFEAKWEQPPWTDTLKPMVIRVWFGPGGRIMKYNLEKSSGDARADATIKSAASRVGSVPHLTADFIDKYRKNGIPIQMQVTP